MLDKKYDSFFDEETPEDRKSGELLKLIDGDKTKLRNFSAGDKVSGKVSRVGTDYLYMDVGAKNEALMKITADTADVKAGDSVEGFVVSNSGGEMIVSRNLSGQSADISVLMEALNNRMPVQGKVTGVAKAGINVKILGHKAFCPISLIDVKYTSDVNGYLGKTLDFVITRITEGGRNIVVSRIPLFEAGMEADFKKLASAAETQKPLKGKISKIADFGLFVETGSLEGLVHISEVSWERAQNLRDSFEAGQEVEFVVLKAERKEPLRNSKISLSIRQSLEDPWTKVAKTVSVGQALSGKVTRLADFGAFVEVLPGVEGLVHVSEMAWGKRIHHPSEVVKAGQAVKVTVLNVDEKKRSISLTLKDVADDPWNGAEKKFAVGAEVPGTVARRAKFGYFIDLADGVTGLLVFGRMAADKKDSLKPGDAVTVTVDSIDIEERRVGLSMGVGEMAKEESEAAKQFLKKQDAAKTEKKHEAAGTEFGAALLSALSSKKTAAPSAVSVKAAEPKDERLKTAEPNDGSVTVTKSMDELIKAIGPKDERIKVTPPADGRVNTAKPNDERVKAIEPKDERIKVTPPADGRVNTAKPNDERVKAIEPKDERIKVTPPVDGRVNTAKPNDERVKAIEPKDERIKVTPPADGRVNTAKPNDVRVKAIEPKDERIKVTPPVDGRVNTAKPNDERVKAAVPNDGSVKAAKPTDERVKATEPKDERVKIKESSDEGVGDRRGGVHRESRNPRVA